MILNQCVSVYVHHHGKSITHDLLIRYEWILNGSLQLCICSKCVCIDVSTKLKNRRSTRKHFGMAT